MAARDERQSAGESSLTATRSTRVPRSFYRSADGRMQYDLHPRDLAEVVRSGDGALWVDIDSTDRHQVALLEKIFHFHPLAIEDTLNPESRVKLEEFDGYLFAVVRVVLFDEETADPYDLATFNLYFFLGKNFLVTVHAESSRSIAAVSAELGRCADLLGRGVDRVMHAVMDMAIDHFFPVIDQIHEFSEQLDERVFVRGDPTAQREIFTVKRLVLSLRRHLAPQREVFNALSYRQSPLLPTASQVYFRDIYDHVLRINDALDTYRELLSGTLDAYLTQVSNRLGAVTKGLSAIATLSIPFVVVSGMWGMNFSRVPLADHPYGFWLLLFIQLGVGVALVLLLKWRKWL